MKESAILVRKSFSYAPVKRALDVGLSALLIVLSAPLTLSIALAIRLSSPGPVLLRQKRIGKDGQPFAMLKFRTMHSAISETPHIEHARRMILEDVSPADLRARSLKIQEDPRITKVGKFLRRNGLDELPQFINVLRGEMSLVGPRPCMPYEWDMYSDWHKRRLSILPGITGLWQVTAHNMVPFSQMVCIDLDYIETMSLWTDLKIILKTPIEMIWGKGNG
jgi:lipopolysaccharide/colanic/teichoic acid biosynthesis glycosyltransferase